MAEETSPTQQTPMLDWSYNEPPLVPPPSLDPTPPRSRKVTFLDAAVKVHQICSEPDAEFYQSPDINSDRLQRKVFLAKCSSQLRAQLQQCHLQGRNLGLSERDVNDSVLPYMFDGLGGKSATSLQYIMHSYTGPCSLIFTVCLHCLSSPQIHCRLWWSGCTQTQGQTVLTKSKPSKLNRKSHI